MTQNRRRLALLKVRRLRAIADRICLQCLKPRDQSPSKRLCIPCLESERERFRRMRNSKPWKPGSRGAQPTTHDGVPLVKVEEA